jgi:hypothetical protein
MTVEAAEKWFVRRGVPHFIDGYSASEDVLTRAVPVLTLVFLFSAISAIDLDWPTWAMVVASGLGLAILVGAWILINRLRGRRRLAPPDRIGWIEVGVFLGVPSLLPLLFGGDLAGSAITLVALLVILGVVYAVTSYGVVPISAWAIKQVFRTLGQTVRLFARSLPLLLLGFMFLFINAEAWQTAGQIDRILLVYVSLLFAFLAALFLGTQIPREIHSLNQFESWSEAMALAEEAPVNKQRADPGTTPSPPELNVREKGNIFLVFFISQGFRLVLVSSLVGILFVLIGLLIIRPETITLWTMQPPDVVWEFTLGRIPMSLTTELLQVSLFLAAFAGVYFSVYTTTDPNLRRDFFEDTVTEMKQNLAVRAIYRS